MEPMVLVAYATRNGSTKEVAHAVAETLRQSELAVDCAPVESVRSLNGYAAVVIGVPLYMGRLHKDARRFLTTHRDALSRIPVAMFVLGPVQKDEKDWTGARGQLEKEMKKYPWLKPVASQIFGGKFDPANLGFPFTLIPPLRKMKAMDARDWMAIRAWTVDVCRKAILRTSPEMSARHV